jgi:acyl-CoA thioester hydrolase
MVSSMRLYTTEIQVRYGETDRMGVAHHTSYLLWFELGRTGLLREAGHSYREMEGNGLLLPVMECNVRFLVGADYDDHVRIETAVAELRSRTVTFAYRATRDHERLTTGWTKHLCVDPDNKIRRIPAETAEAIAPYLIPPGERFPDW